MAEFNGENNFGGVFGGASFSTENANTNSNETVFRKVESDSLPTKQSIWTKIRSFLFQDLDLYAPVKVELTPYQQKVEDEINDFHLILFLDCFYFLPFYNSFLNVNRAYFTHF